MRSQLWSSLVVLAAAGAGVADALAGTAPTRQELGRQVKLRILVDKVMQPTEGWATKEWMIKATAEAGFNVFSPRRGHELLDQVRQVTQWCEKHGIHHMPWMRGSLSAPAGPEADGKRLVWANGTEQPLWSPNSDEFWAWTSRYIVEYAKMSAQNKHLMGVFLDYENYEKGHQGNLYGPSYDDVILGKFAKARGIQLPGLRLTGRAEWLKKQGLHDAFAAFQIAHWRERCRALRKAVDAHDPTFQFCVYPAPGTPFMIEAIYPEWATEAAPLILADACTYGRPSRVLPEAASLQGNRQRLLENRKVPKERGTRHIYAGGIDPAVKGADPEFCGKNAVAISDVTDGYWVFYEGPKYGEDHPAYWKWFTWANQAIAAGNFAAQHEPRQTPDSWGLDLLQRIGKPVGLLPPPVTGETVRFPMVKLRQENLLLIAAKADTPVTLTLRQHPVARYQSPLMWELHDPAWKRIASGAIAHGTSDTVRFTPATGGIYFLAASAGPCACSVESANAPVSLHAGEGLSVIYGAGRLYFHVPEGVARFTLAVRGSGGETVRLNVFDPEGRKAGSIQTTATSERTSLELRSGDGAGRTWSLELTRADTGVLEDSSIQLGRELPPALALHPAHVFRCQAHAAATERATRPLGIPTFACVGLYWRPSDGGEQIPCNVECRERGAAQWRKALPLWYDRRDSEYRGSVVNLKPGTTYEMQLSLGGAKSAETISVTTWNEAFPIARTVHLPSGASREPLTVTEGGTADRYVLYTSARDGRTTIDVADQSENCIKVRASYVIIRGLTLKGAQRDGILLQGVHDVIIEENDISGWGRKNRFGFGVDEDAGIKGAGRLQRIVLQRNKIHHPRHDSSNWEEKNEEGSHPGGPQGIVFDENAGNHVFRYNEIYSDEDHCFNDGMGHWKNFSTNGFPGPDTDVYGNIVADVWDDALEIEGGGRNVRVWGNYLDQTYVGIGTATCSVGPLYIFRNVMARSRIAPGNPDTKERGVFGKLGDKGSYGVGRQYWFHNTVLQPTQPGSGMPLGVVECLASWGGPFTKAVSSELPTWPPAVSETFWGFRGGHGPGSRGGCRSRGTGGRLR